MSIKAVEQYKVNLNKNDFTADELKLIDIEGLSRNYLKIEFKSLGDDEYFVMRDIAKLQYKLPIKYLKPVPNSFSYICQKSLISGNEKDIRNAAVTIVPLNPNVQKQISYTPINQSLPLGTIVTIDVDVEYTPSDPNITPQRRFIWSDNLKTDKNISEIIKRENPKSIYTKPWIQHCHYCAIDIGSQLNAKYEVAEVDLSIYASFSLFGFSRSDERKEFTIWTFNYFNITPVDVLKMISKQNNIEPNTKKIIEEIISKVK